MKIFSEFGLNPILIVANIVNFLILLFLLQRFLYKPVLKMLETRKEKIAAAMKQAEEIEARLAQASEEQEKILTKANREATSLIADASKESKELMEKTRVQAKKMTEEMMIKAEVMMAAEKEKMMHELKGDLADMMVKTMSKVTGKILSQDDQRKLVVEAEKEISA